MKLYNTLTRKKDTLNPLESNTVKIYTCGLTVYSQPHIGNWVSYIYWDVLVRTLKLSGRNVVRVQNITDVGHLVSDEDSGEDKMEKGAKKEGITAWDVAEKYIKIAEHEAYELLGLIRPNHMPRATEYITEQIDFVAALESSGFTYEIRGDGIYFDTSKLEDYGKLAGLDIEGLKAGARVAYEGKRNITDFALWKYSPNPPAGGQKRDMEWDSPWGRGFPGWHLECSVMAREILGDEIDIHTGGIDHIPVHHTNEIAQTEAVTGKPFAQIWLHNAHLKVEGGKMAKSLGNVYTLQDILDKGLAVEAYKLMILSKHYKTEGDFTWDNLTAAQNRLSNYYAFADLQFQTNPDANLLGDSYFSDIKKQLLESLNDDLDTVKALALINQVIDHVESYGNGIHSLHKKEFIELLRFIDDLLGLSFSGRKDISKHSYKLIAERQSARDQKDWQKSDKLRDELLEQGLKIKDTPNGPVWSKVD